MNRSEESETTPEHIRNTVRASDELHLEHTLRTPRLTRVVYQITEKLGRPVAILVFSMVSLLWMILNIMAVRSGVNSFDRPPFNLYSALCGFLAVLITLMILTSQQHQNGMAENRAKMTLELAMLSEQKSAKIIEMLDHLRRDMPDVKTLYDPTLAKLIHSSEPQKLIDSLQESRRMTDDETRTDS